MSNSSEPSRTRASKTMMPRQMLNATREEGMTLKELEDAVIHIGVYAGMPAAVQSFRIASRALAEMREAGELSAT